MHCKLVAFALIVGVVAGGCGTSTLASPAGGTPDPTTDDGGSSGSSGGEGDGEAGNPAVDAGIPTFDDGTPSRIACTKTLGNGLTPVHGRLDGELVAIVSATERKCPSDGQHLHLQVKMAGALYDIAVNLDGLEGETDAPLPGLPFAEGWHPMDLDYVRDLGLHSTALTLTTPSAIRQRVETVLASANHIAVYGYGYTGSDGAHLIHRSAGGHDGALIINPLASKAHVIAFRFANDTF